jgi:hypothetical protein
VLNTIKQTNKQTTNKQQTGISVLMVTPKKKRYSKKINDFMVVPACFYFEIQHLFVEYLFYI